MYSNLKNKILPLSSTRVWRTYTGGKEIERWEGIENPVDSEIPEEWIASTVKATNPGREHIVEGLSKLKLSNFEDITLKEVIYSDPIGFLGKNHFDKLGNNTGVLVKIIDSLCRLSIQVHPDKKYAKNVMNSNYGKTESWYILGGRKVNGEDPYVLMGFKPLVSREHWKKLFDEQNIPGMIDCLNKIYVKPGEAYFIEGGVPHAIGPGCFLIEIQEPTDYTMRVERKTDDGKLIPDSLCHQGVGFEKLFDCFNYDNVSLDEALKRWRITPKKIMESNQAVKWEIIGKDCTNLFSMNRLDIKKTYKSEGCDTFHSITVISGTGSIIYNSETINIKQGDLLFVPASVGKMTIEADDGSTLELIRCYPPVV
ncbi:type I phosphomannose isomerase catalytic subunit [Clostridium sp.]